MSQEVQVEEIVLSCLGYSFFFLTSYGSEHNVNWNMYLLQRSYEDVKSAKYSSHFIWNGERAFEHKVQSFGHLYFGKTNVADLDHTVAMAKSMSWRIVVVVVIEIKEKVNQKGRSRWIGVGSDNYGKGVSKDDWEENISIKGRKVKK